MTRRAIALGILIFALIGTGVGVVASRTGSSSAPAAHTASLQHRAAALAPSGNHPAKAQSQGPSQGVEPVDHGNRHSHANHAAGHSAGKVTNRHEPKQAKREASNGPITYTVKPGDNLYNIAKWFKLHGYGALYRWNKKVIGNNPALIFPGQRITVSLHGNKVHK
jgi:nucleoid-associated protein YgaU